MNLILITESQKLKNVTEDAKRALLAPISIVLTALFSLKK